MARTATQKTSKEEKVNVELLEDENEKLRREVEQLRSVRDSYNESLSFHEDIINTFVPVISIKREKRDLFLGDKEFKRLCMELFKLGPRRYRRLRKKEIQELKMVLFNRFKVLLIEDWEKNTKERHTHWSIAGVNILSHDFDVITDNDRILIAAKHLAHYRVKQSPQHYRSGKTIEMRVKICIHSHDFPELQDEIKPIQGKK